MQKDVQNKETAQRQEHGAVNENASGMHAKRTYKSRLFEMIFSEKRALLDLYNAMNGTEYNDPELLEINTLENAIYMSMKNDLSFIIDSNMPAVWALRLQWNWQSRNVSEKIFCRNFLVRIERR